MFQIHRTGVVISEGLIPHRTAARVWCNTWLSIVFVLVIAGIQLNLQRPVDSRLVWTFSGQLSSCRPLGVAR